MKERILFIADGEELDVYEARKLIGPNPYANENKLVRYTHSRVNI